MINIASIGTVFVILIILTCAYLSFKNVKKSVILYLFFLFLFPYSWSFTSVFHLYLQAGSKTVDLVELLFLYVLGLALAVIIHRRAVRVISRRQLLIHLLWLLTLLVFFVVGLLVNPARYVFADMRHLMYFGSIFFLITFIQTKKDLAAVLKGLIVAGLLFSGLDFAIYIGRQGLFSQVLKMTQWQRANRIGFTNSYLVFVIVPLAFNSKLFFDRQSWRMAAYAAALFLSATVVISKSVTMLAALLFVIAGALIAKLLGEWRRSLTKQRFYAGIVALFSIAALAAACVSLPAVQSSVVGELMLKAQLALSDPMQLTSWQSRKLTNAAAFAQFSQNPFGHGLGETFQTYIQTGASALTNALYVDQLFPTILVKMGVFGLAMFIFYQAAMLILLIRQAQAVRPSYRSFVFGLAAGYAAFFISAVSTSHLLLSPIVILTQQLLLAIAAVVCKPAESEQAIPIPIHQEERNAQIEKVSHG